MQARYIVEVEVVMPETMTVGQSHDLSLELQHKIESDPMVERAYVHNDYIHREEPEHKVHSLTELLAVSCMSRACCSACMHLPLCGGAISTSSGRRVSAGWRRVVRQV